MLYRSHNFILKKKFFAPQKTSTFKYSYSFKIHKHKKYISDEKSTLQKSKIFHKHQPVLKGNELGIGNGKAMERN